MVGSSSSSQMLEAILALGRGKRTSGQGRKLPKAGATDNSNASTSQGVEVTSQGPFSEGSE